MLFWVTKVRITQNDQRVGETQKSEATLLQLLLRPTGATGMVPEGHSMAKIGFYALEVLLQSSCRKCRRIVCRDAENGATLLLWSQPSTRRVLVFLHLPYPDGISSYHTSELPYRRRISVRGSVDPHRKCVLSALCARTRAAVRYGGDLQRAPCPVS